MTLDYKNSSEVGDEYLRTLKSLKPEVNTDQNDSDWWVRSRVIGGVFSGVYADQQKVNKDIFPKSARLDALERHLETWGLEERKAAQQAEGSVLVTGAIGSTISIGLQFQHAPTDNIYTASSGFVMSATAAIVPVISVGTGQSQNLLTGTILALPSPPGGVNSSATVISLSDGRDQETEEEMAQRILDRIQNPLSGGTETDYEFWATESDPAVTSAKILRFPFGPGTVGVYITSGTTNIDEAIDENQPIIRQPSAQLIEKVYDYIDALNPITDCHYVFGIQEIPLDVTMNVRFIDGITGSTVLEGQSLTAIQLVEREIKRALYKIPTGGRLVGGSGYIFASELEEAIDDKLSSSPYAEGSLAQIIADRQCQNLSASGVNRLILGSQAVIPGTLSVVEL